MGSPCRVLSSQADDERAAIAASCLRTPHRTLIFSSAGSIADATALEEAWVWGQVRAHQ